MKRYIIYILSVILFSSCTESFLDRYPLDEISSYDYWKTTKDLELYVNQYYPSLPGYPDGQRGGRGSIYWADDNSDNQICESYNIRLAGMQTIPASGGSWNFSNIRSLNYFLTSYHTVEDNWENIRHYVGEAYFFRAYFYFDLLVNYGDVPWINRPLDPDNEELYAKRTPRNVIADSIIADLDKAISYMKPKSSAPKDRVNRDAALLFKSRVCLFEGTWDKYHASDPFGVTGSDGGKYLTLASQAAKELIDNGDFSIYYQGNPGTDYGFLFIQEDLDDNPEIILARNYDADLDLFHYSQQLLMWPNGRGITKRMVESYLCTDGLPISNSPLYQGDVGLTSVATNRDLRLYECVWFPGDPLKIVGTDTVTRFLKPYIDKSGNYRDNTGYMLKKGLDPYTEDINQKMEIAAIIFRYAEALLNYAEAQAELGIISQTDIDLTINILRERAGIAPLSLNNIETDPNWDFTSLSPIINEVRRERRVELAFEGFRFNDLLRWNAHNLFVNKRPKGIKFNQSDFPELVIGEDIFVDEYGYLDPYQSTLPSGYGFKTGRDYLLAIPTLELTLNGNLIQNPGW